MGVNVKPIGYIDVTAEGASYRPIVDFAPLVIVGAGVLGLTALRLLKSLAKRKVGLICVAGDTKLILKLSLN